VEVVSFMSGLKQGRTDRKQQTLRQRRMSDRVGACHKSQDVIKTEKERSFHMS